MSDAARNALSADDMARGLTPSELKECCAAVYGSPAAKLLLGDSLHPGGTRLTARLGRLLTLTPQTRVLDVAAGRGTSAIFLASHFGCEVFGIDYSSEMIDEAEHSARSRGLSSRVSFQCADAERLPFPDEAFDVVICECAFCTFPDKQAAAREFARALRIGGRVGVSDLTRNGALDPELDSLMSWVSCIADAQPLTTYAQLFTAAGLTMQVTEEHDNALIKFIDQIRMRLFAGEVLAGLRKLNMPGLNFEVAKNMTRQTLTAVREGRLGYALMTAIK